MQPLPGGSGDDASNWSCCRDHSLRDEALRRMKNPARMAGWTEIPKKKAASSAAFPFCNKLSATGTLRER